MAGAVTGRSTDDQPDARTVGTAAGGGTARARLRPHPGDRLLPAGMAPAASPSPGSDRRRHPFAAGYRLLPRPVAAAGPLGRTRFVQSLRTAIVRARHGHR